MAEESKFQRLIAFLSRPPVAVIASLCSIISIPLAAYLYLASIRTPELSLCLHPIRTPIVQTALASDISVTFKGQPVKGDMTAAQFAIWNGGQQPIRQDDVLKPFAILTGDGSPIYESAIQKLTRDVTGIRLDTTQLSNGQVRIHWNILEKNDGAVVQVIYGGTPQTEFKVQGTTVGQGGVVQKPFSSGQSPAELKQLMLSLGSILVLIPLVGTLIDLFTKKGFKVLIKNVLITACFGTFAFLFIYIGNSVLPRYVLARTPPFGF
jgi:hypothetical protein